MVKKSDSSATATRIMREQGARLERLRVCVGMKQTDAARLAGVTRDAWGRMERAGARVDIIALARFSTATSLPAGYVVSGDFSGLPPELVRDLIRAERGSDGPEETDSAAPSGS